MSGSKILEGLKDAVAGNFASVTIEGQRWVRADAPRACDLLTADDAWHDLVEKDDRNSPEEYPEMCLITQGELRDYMRRSSSSGVLDPSDDIYYEGYEQARSDLSAALTPSPDFSEVTVQTPQYIIEGIILRRLHEKRIEGYTLEMSKEIAATLAAVPPSTAITGDADNFDPAEWEGIVEDREAQIATPPAAAPDQGVREAEIRAILGEEVDIDFSARRIDYGDAIKRIAALSRPAPDAAGSDLSKPLIGAIVAALGQRARTMHPNGRDQAFEDLNAFKKWADASEVVPRHQGEGGGPRS